MRKPLNVWYLCFEDPLYAVKRKTLAFCYRHNVDQQRLMGRLFIHSGRDFPVNLVNRNGRRQEYDKDTYRKIVNFIKENMIDVWIVDPFVDSHSMPENENTAMNVVVKTFVKIAEEANCAIELVHHVRKGNGRIDANDLRGSSSVMSGVRSLRTVNPISERMIAEQGLPKDFNGFYVKTEKNNLTKKSRKETWFALDSVPVGSLGGEKGAVVPIEPFEERAKGRPKDVRDYLLEVIELMEPQTDSDEEGGFEYLDYTPVRDEFFRVVPVQEVDDEKKMRSRRRSAFARALDLLEGDKVLRVRGDRGADDAKIQLLS